MKKLYALLLSAAEILLFSTAAIALENDDATLNVITSVPRDMIYQGILKDNAGNPLADSAVTLTLRIYDDYTVGDLEWSDALAIVTDDGGYFTATLAMVNLPFDEDYWLELEVDSEILSPRQKINMVGYAARSDTSEYAASGGGWVDDGLNVRLEASYDKVGIGTSSPTNKLHVTGSESVPILNVEQTGSFRATRFYSLNACALWVEHSGNHGLRVTNANGSGIYIQNAGGDGVHVGNATGWAGFFDGTGYFADNVGLGTLSPQERLDVSGNIRTTGFKMPTGASSGYVLTSDGSGTGTWLAPSGGSDSDWVISDTNMYSGVSGNVGIGTETPSEKLEVSGNLKIGGKATIGTGHYNTGDFAFVAGNSNYATSSGCVISGGQDNVAMDNYSTVGGGYHNTANGLAATVAGGYNDSAAAYYSTIGGGQYNYVYGENGTICGGSYNSVGGGYSTVAGGNYNQAYGSYSAICGGNENNASGTASSIGGGGFNYAANSYSSIGGGKYNRARGLYSVVGGGGGANQADSNAAIGDYSTIGGGRKNNAGALSTTIGGGESNAASYAHCTIGGGITNNATGAYNTIGGGFVNFTGQTGSTISGGYHNTASGVYSAIGGGGDNSVSGVSSAIGGGWDNTIDGDNSAIPGGYQCNLSNLADYSMAFGRGVYIDSSYRVAFFEGDNSGFLGVNRDDNDGGILHPITYWYRHKQR